MRFFAFIGHLRLLTHCNRAGPNKQRGGVGNRAKIDDEGNPAPHKRAEGNRGNYSRKQNRHNPRCRSAWFFMRAQQMLQAQWRARKRSTKHKECFSPNIGEIKALFRILAATGGSVDLWPEITFGKNCCKLSDAILD